MYVNLSHNHQNIGENETGSRANHSLYAFGLINNDRTGKLKLTISYYVIKGEIHDEVIDEAGPSAIDMNISQQFYIAIFKKVSNEWEEVLREYPTHFERLDQHDYDYGEGGTDSVTEDVNGARVIEIQTQLDIDEGQEALLNLGIVSRLWFWSDDYGMVTNSYFEARLDKVEAEIV